jgi:hypothetical protein
MSGSSRDALDASARGGGDRPSFTGDAFELSHEGDRVGARDAVCDRGRVARHTPRGVTLLRGRRTGQEADYDEGVEWSHVFQC